ncbi:MAG TPA: SDR family NAD(P)-dependent oxidoreductase, partial [Vicinamibacteria bacterium]|nr:SDR family NAD(P)-dependent oxidoreductase [Vicinamibacteria bacterium]
MPRTWYVTRGVVGLEGDGHVPAVAGAALWGLGRVIALEHPESWGGLVDLSSDAEPDSAALLLAEIDAAGGEDAVALHEQGRFVPRLVRSSTGTTGLPELKGDATYLITGGLGALGLQVARWLVDRGARHLVLVGRSAPSAAATEALAAMEAAGAHIVVTQADVAQQHELARVLAHAKEALPPLRGIVHAAGLVEDGPLVRLDWPRFERVLAPKVAGAWNLHLLTRDDPLDFFLLFSSAASLLGAPAQGNYAAANAFLDALARYRQAAGLPASSINWGAWAGAGMSAAVDERLKQLWRSRGLELLDRGQALDALGSLVAEPRVQVGVMSVSWPRFAESIAGGVTPPLLRDLLPLEAPGAGRPSEDGVLDRFLRARENERAGVLQAYLQQQLASVLDIDRTAIQPTTNLLELGMDSLLMMEVINRCKRDLKLRLFPREIYERPTFDALCAYLAAELAIAHGLSAAGAEAAAAPTPDRPGSLTPPALTQPSPTRVAVKNPRIVFLLSTPRAGSTLLRVMLAGHPELFCPPELHLLPFDTMKERERGLERTYLGEGLLRAVMEVQQEDAEPDLRLASEWVEKDIAVQDVYAWLQHRVHPRVLVDKSPSYGGRMDVLQKAEALFEDAHYIFLTRHPYAVIESFVRNRMEKIVGGDASDAHRRAEQVWSDMNANIVQFLRRVDPRRQLTVRYEDLVSQPARVGREITDFLGLEWDAAILKPYEGRRMTDGVKPGSLGIGDPNLLDHDSIDPSLGDAWRAIRLPRGLSPETCRLARELGYELPNEPAGENEGDAGLRIASIGMNEQAIDVRGRRL